MRPNIYIVSDYDGYFEAWATKLADELEAAGNVSIKTINVSSGPFKDCGMKYVVSEGTLYLDFYSAVRSGFGSIGITQAEFARILRSS